MNTPISTWIWRLIVAAALIWAGFFVYNHTRGDATLFCNDVVTVGCPTTAPTSKTNVTAPVDRYVHDPEAEEASELPLLQSGEGSWTYGLEEFEFELCGNTPAGVCEIPGNGESEGGDDLVISCWGPGHHLVTYVVTPGADDSTPFNGDACRYYWGPVGYDIDGWDAFWRGVLNTDYPSGWTSEIIFVTAP